MRKLMIMVSLLVGVGLLSAGAVTGQAQTQTPALTTLAGPLTKSDKEYLVNNTPVSFGPKRHITRATASADYDGDGTAEIIMNELDGLVGQNVTLTGEQEAQGDFDVFTINGAAYRDPQAGRPPWAGGPHAAGGAKQKGKPPWAGGGQQGAGQQQKQKGRPPWAGGPNRGQQPAGSGTPPP